jgi:zinc protease
LAEKYYGEVSARQVAQTKRVAEPPQLAARRLTMTDPRVTNPSLSRTYLAPSYLSGATEHAPALEVLASLLGGSPTSRLYRELVVDQKVAAGAGAWYQGGSRDLTRFGVYAVPVPGGKVEALEGALDEVLDRLLVGGVSEEEVERAKRNLVAEFVYAQDSLLSKAQLYGASLAVGLSVEDVEQWPEKIRGVTVRAVNAAATAVLQGRTSVTGILIPTPGNDAKEPHS